MKEFLSKLRKDYGIMGLDLPDLNPDPIMQFETWFTEAANAEIVEPNAFTLSTVSAEGKPSSRIVLLRNFEPTGFTFYTNYTSKKGLDMDANPNVCMNFFWADVERQIRIEGIASKINTLESMEYFNKRPRASQIGAWASAQSSPIDSRADLNKRIAEIEQQFQGKTVDKPPFWGGYRVMPMAIEFWQGRPSRLHDRFRYSLKQDNTWKIERLNP